MRRAGVIAFPRHVQEQGGTMRWTGKHWHEGRGIAVQARRALGPRLRVGHGSGAGTAPSSGAPGDIAFPRTIGDPLFVRTKTIFWVLNYRTPVS